MMKRNFILTLLIFAVAALNAQPWINYQNNNTQNDFHSIQKEFNKYWDGKDYKKGHGWKQFKRWEYFWDQRLGENGEFPDMNDQFNELMNVKQKSKKFLAEQPQWNLAGPVNTSKNLLAYDSRGLGRLNCVEFHPDDPDEIWVGSASGGAWYTKNNGKDWNVIKLSGVMSLGVSDIAISESDPNVIYIATGDQNGSWMTRGYSIGIIKSIDGGLTWERTELSRVIQNRKLIGRILVHPEDPDIVIAGTGDGIYITEDGGDTWEQSVSNDFFRDMEMHPTNPGIIYAAGTSNSGTRIIRSIDSGKTFQQIYFVSQSNRIELAVTEAAPDNIYALASSRQDNGFYGFYRSENKGSTWDRRSTSPNILSINPYGNGDGGQGSYDLALAVSPDDPDLIYSGGIHIWKSQNGGANWSLVNHWTGGYSRPFVHADQHWLEYHPDSKNLFSANDGGIYRSPDGGNNWIDLSNGLPISQFYRISVVDHYDGMVMGGTQDCGTHILKEGEWLHIHGGDGMECIIDPNNKNIIYASTHSGNLVKSNNGGKNFDPVYSPYSLGEYSGWVTPFVLHPEKDGHILVGSENLYLVNTVKSTAQNLTNFSQRAIINSIVVSESDPDYIYIGRNRNIYKTKDGGESWARIFTAPQQITDIEISQNNNDKIWVSVSGYREGKKIYKIVNSNSENFSDNLPNFPVNTIVEQDNSAGILYAGTDIGVFKYNPIKDIWEIFNNGLPYVVVNELEINYQMGRLYAGTFGRGIWYANIIDCNIDKPEITVSGSKSFCEGDSTVLYLENEFNDFFWSEGSEQDSLVVKESGLYYVVAFDKNGCSVSSDKIRIEVFNVPELYVNSTVDEPLEKCEGDSLKMTATYGFEKYLWSTGDTARSITIFEPGIYSLTARTEKGCMSSLDSIKVVEKESPDKPGIHQFKDTLFTHIEARAYRWYFNGKIIPGSNSRKLGIEENGKYVVEVFGDNWCSTASDTLQAAVSVHGQNIPNAAQISIQPNPSNGIFKIKSSYNTKADIEVSDIYGKVIISKDDVFINNHDLNIQAFSNGVYYIRIKFSKSSVVRKIIKI